MAKKAKEEERKFILQFIEVYQSLPALWNVKSKDYKNLKKKNEQYKQLLRKYRERFPDADKNQLKQKLNSLRTNFRKELKRIKDSKKSGTEAYEPTLWYFEEMKFLIGQEEVRTSLNTTKIEYDEQESEVVDEEKQESDVVDEEEQESEVVDNVGGTSAINTIIHEYGPPKRKSRNLDETQDVIWLPRKRLQHLQSEFEITALGWAAELQKMEPRQQLFAKKFINDILFEGRMGYLRRFSDRIVVKNPSPSSSVSSLDSPEEESQHTAQMQQSNNFSSPTSPYSSVQPSTSMYHHDQHSLQEQSQQTAQMQQSSVQPSTSAYHRDSHSLQEQSQQTAQMQQSSVQPSTNTYHSGSHSRQEQSQHTAQKYFIRSDIVPKFMGIHTKSK